MSTTVLHAPRIAAYAPVDTGFWQRVWKALEAHGQRRAAAALHRAEWSYRFSDPVRAQTLRQAALQFERS